MYKYKAAWYTPLKAEVKELSSLDEVDQYLKAYGNIFLSCVKVTPEELERIGRKFNLNWLALDDCVSKRQRPKVEGYEDHFFLILKAVEHSQSIKTQQIGVFVGKNYLVSISETCPDCLEPIFKKIGEKSPRILRAGTDYLCYEIIDLVVDGYFPVLDMIEKEIGQIEENIIDSSIQQPLNRIFHLRRDLISLRKIIWPTREMIMSLEKENLPNFQEKTVIYYRDIYDHVLWLGDMIENYRELLSGSLDTHLLVVSNRLNEIVKALTVVTALILVPSLIAGIYGMNFQHMPGQDNQYGFYAVIAVMAFVIIAMAVYFMKRKWI